MKALETRKAEIMAIMASAEAPPVVRLHPNAAEVYRRKVAKLELALNDDSIKAEAAEILRSLIDRIPRRGAAAGPLDAGAAAPFGALAEAFCFCGGLAGGFGEGALGNGPSSHWWRPAPKLSCRLVSACPNSGLGFSITSS